MCFFFRGKSEQSTSICSRAWSGCCNHTQRTSLKSDRVSAHAFRFVVFFVKKGVYLILYLCVVIRNCVLEDLEGARPANELRVEV